jgi:hypothetical protein
MLPPLAAIDYAKDRRHVTLGFESEFPPTALKLGTQLQSRIARSK